MTRATKVLPLALLANRHLAVASRCIRRPYHLTRACQGLALVGLVVGILVLVLPSAALSQFSLDVPGMLECTVMRPPQILVLGLGESSVLSSPEARQVAVMGPQVSPPPDNLVRDDCDLDDDDPVSLPVLSRWALCLPLPSARIGVIDAADAFPWPFPYLARPQLLTRR
jgi:hypothetical protein